MRPVAPEVQVPGGGAPWDVANRVATPGQRGFSEGAARRRERRWELLRWQWAHSSLKRLHHCRLHANGELVTLRRSARGSYWTGLQTCGSVWACPVCSAIIRTRRALTIEESVRSWLAGDSRWVAFLTLTVRHHQGDGLAGLYEGMAAGWKRLQQSRWWRALGWAGSWRSCEVTFGSTNGWHPHMHLLLFGEGPRLDLAAIGAEVADRWRAAVVAAGMEPTTLANGARLQAVTMDGGGLGEYLSKVLDGDGEGWDVGSELARSDVKRSKGGHSPMQVLEAATDGEVWAIRRWREYEQATFGRRAIEASRGLLDRLGVEDQADDDLVAVDEGGEAVLDLHRSQYPRLALAGYAARVLDVDEVGDQAATVRFVEAVLRLVTP